MILELIKIRFGSLIWEVNPSEIKVEYENAADEEFYINGTSQLFSEGMKLKKVKGKGIFFSDEPDKEYGELEKVFLKGGEDMLILPGTVPFKAAFTGLKQYYPEGGDYIGYEFVFTECKAYEREKPKLIYVEADESLWDIGYSFGVETDELVRLNPHIENINFTKEGERVYLWE